VSSAKILLVGSLLSIVFVGSATSRETINYEKNCMTLSVDSSSVTKSVRYYVVSYDENGIQHANQKGSVLNTENDDIETKDLESCVPVAKQYNTGAVLFDFDQFYLKDSQTPKIDSVYKSKIANQSFKRIVVDGYADSKGTPVYNMKLSIERANRVANYLQSLGVDKHLIVTRGFGESKNDTAEDGRENPKDRKVIISVVTK